MILDCAELSTGINSALAGLPDSADAQNVAPWGGTTSPSG